MTKWLYIAAILAAHLGYGNSYAESIGRSDSAELTRRLQGFLNLRFGMFIHYDMATYENQARVERTGSPDWATGTASPKIFRPESLDTRQWARAAKSAGMTYACMTTKHHGGFCVWDSALTDYDVGSSDFPKVDVVKEFVDAFRPEGLKVYLYYSILDLNKGMKKGRGGATMPAGYMEYVKGQLSELLTNYGPIDGVVFDGWWAPWSRISYEQLSFSEIYNHIKRLQPDCLVSEHNAKWYSPYASYYGDFKQYEARAGQKTPADNNMPAQAGHTLQDRWFWKQHFLDPDFKMKTAEEVVDEYVLPLNERRCNFLLNVAPNSDGRIDENAVIRLKEIGDYLKSKELGEVAELPEIVIPITTPNLADGSVVTASSVAGISEPHSALLSHVYQKQKAWQANPEACSGWLEIDFRKPVTFNTVVLSEPNHVAHIQEYRIEYWADGAWKNWVGSDRGHAMVQIHQAAPVMSDKVRLHILKAAAPFAVDKVSVHLEPGRRG